MRPIIKVNNKLKGAFGETTTIPGKRPIVQINVKRHKTHKMKKRQTKKESLADTIHHELLHAKHPKMLEKTVYKKTAKAMKNVTTRTVRKLVDKVKGKTGSQMLASAMKKINKK